MLSIQKKIWLERAGLLEESPKEKISDDEIENILSNLEKEKGWHEGDDENDDEDEKKEHIKEDAGPIQGKVSSDTKGKLHELLVGYHLKGGSHMSKHPDKEGDSPKQAHDKLKKTVHPTDYKKINARAKSAAEDIRKQVEVGGHKIHDVHWTSKPGDIQRSTGIKSSQQQDSSDIVVTTRKKGK
jgi:hypothetical protein